MLDSKDNDASVTVNLNFLCMLVKNFVGYKVTKLSIRRNFLQDPHHTPVANNTRLMLGSTNKTFHTISFPMP